MHKLIRFTSFGFVDVRGRYRHIAGCPLKQRQELAGLLIAIAEQLDQSKMTTIAELYDGDFTFKALADRAIEVCGIDPAWLSIDMLAQFLFPYKDGEEIKRPLLEELNFPQVPDTGERGAEYEEVIAGLWTHTDSLPEAMQAAGYEPGEALPFDQLSKVLKHRNAMADPDYRNKPRVSEEELIDVVESISKATTAEEVRLPTPEEIAAIEALL